MVKNKFHLRRKSGPALRWPTSGIWDLLFSSDFYIWAWTKDFFELSLWGSVQSRGRASSCVRTLAGRGLRSPAAPRSRRAASPDGSRVLGAWRDGAAAAQPAAGQRAATLLTPTAGTRRTGRERSEHANWGQGSSHFHAVMPHHEAARQRFDAHRTLATAQQHVFLQRGPGRLHLPPAIPAPRRPALASDPQTDNTLAFLGSFNAPNISFSG